MDDLTVLILTYNEQENIVRTLAALPATQNVLLVDSGSTDGTTELARSARPNVNVLEREFDSFAAQCNFGLSQITTEWVLSLDADYILTPELRAEIAALDPASNIAGYSVDFRYCIFGRPLRSTVYPARTVLYRRQRAQYRNEGHGHRVTIDGNVEKLRGKIDHDDRKSLSHWISSQGGYAKVEAGYLLSRPVAELPLQDRLRRKIFFAAPVMFLYLLFGRGLILDGWPGWFYVAQRTIAELLLSLRLLIERKKLNTNEREPFG